MHKLDYRFRADLNKLRRAINIIYIKIDQELVNCRRLNKYTLTYKELESEFESSIHRYEKYYLQAILSSKTL